MKTLSNGGTLNTLRNRDMKKFNKRDHLTMAHIKAIQELSRINPDLIYCGSLALVIGGVINRHVHDIDLILPDNSDKTLGPLRDAGFRYDSGLESSNIFQVGVNKVQCIKLRWKFGIEVDTFAIQGEQDIRWRYVDFFGCKIKVEDAKSAIAIKIEYVKTNPNLVSVLKHMRDLIEAGVKSGVMIDTIDVARARLDKNGGDEDLPW